MFILKTKISITIENSLGQEVSIQRSSQLYPNAAQVERCLFNTLSLSEKEITELTNEISELYIKKTKGIRKLLGENFETQWSENE